MAVIAADLVERWRDLGPTLWLVAAVAAGLWFVLFSVLAAATEPRKVDAGPETLELGGPEPPAVVNLVTKDWRLGHESLPATLLDLAARRHLAIEQLGDQTYVRVVNKQTPDPTTDYEDMVLGHVRRLAAQAGDGMVPCEALTTGPDHSSSAWWSRYRKAVERDARDRGLSRRRWSPGVHGLLAVTAVGVSVIVGLAVSTLPESSDDDDANPVTAGIGLGVAVFGGFAGIVETAGKRPRDTPTGREAAARWLGLREMLGENTLFADHPPAGVAIWDRHLAYGAALGVAHAAVRALPLGAESDETAWSPVGGRWRVVQIRYPNRVPPAYGRHPLRAATVGMLQLGIAAAVLAYVPAAIVGTRELLVDEGLDAAGTSGAELGARIAALVVTALGVIVAARALWMLAFGALDLCTGRRTVEGRVLRFRRRGDERERGRWYMAVDDGSANRLRAWRFASVQQPNQGKTVRASVTQRLQHVKGLEIVEATPMAASASTLEMTASGD